MLSHVWSTAAHGVDARPIIIETHIESGLPKYTVVGLPDGAVRESRDRIWAALKNAGLPVPRGAITVNLAPADVRKEGAAFDLPIAMGVLAASQAGASEEWLATTSILGELALDGTVRPVRGVLPMALRARKEGRTRLLVPEANATEAAVVEGVEVFPIRTIRDAYTLLWQHAAQPDAVIADIDALFADADRHVADFSDVRGQENVKRALEVAAAGGHNAIMVGPPGSGKTMLARRMPGILPPMTVDEALETTKIYSVSGHLSASGDSAQAPGLVASRPFRAPHHTISDAGLCGGGVHPQPGEISLAHNGVLFLDELPEFKRQVLEVLRQPLEDGHITISRARSSVTFPARFMLVASMNPCPCGHLTDPSRTCVCAPPQIQRYLSKISGPLLDRMDLHVEVSPVPFDALRQKADAEPSTSVRARVIAARQIQQERFARARGVHCNAQMTPPLVRKHAALCDEGQSLMKLAIERLGLSARAYDRILKVSRTIADLASVPAIRAEHVGEAIQYRSLDRQRWMG